MEKREFKAGNMLYPVPAVMVSCQYPDETDPECTNPALAGKPNIITVAWAGTVCTNPPMLSISVRPERYSYHMIAAAGEFVVNLTTEALVRATDYCGVRSGQDVDKFRETGLTPLASRKVSVPGIAESPVNLECRVRSITPLGSHHMILAEVVAVTVSEEYMDSGGKFRLNDTGLVTYSHGEYFLLGKRLGSFGYSVAKQRRARQTDTGSPRGQDSGTEDGHARKKSAYPGSPVWQNNGSEDKHARKKSTYPDSPAWQNNSSEDGRARKKSAYPGSPLRRDDDTNKRHARKKASPRSTSRTKKPPR